MEAQTASPASPWPARHRRAEQLRERYPFAAEVLTLYLALLAVQEPAYETAAALPPVPEAVPSLARDLLPGVVEATVAAGPPGLADAVVGRYHSADLDDLVARWLSGGEQSLVDRYLARAATAPFLEAGAVATSPAARGRGLDSTAPSALPGHLSQPVGEGRRRSCPRCDGPPQFSYYAVSGEPLVTGPRRLACARCATEWPFPRLVCAGCGEETSSRLPIYSEAERFPHVRIDGCETCHGYLLGIDLRRDAAAVPAVDELAALPLDLYARERGLSKVVPNLMGF